MQNSLDKNVACFSKKSQRFKIPDRSGCSLLSTGDYKIRYSGSAQFSGPLNQPLLVRSYPGFETAFFARMPTGFCQLGHSALFDQLYGQMPYKSNAKAAIDSHYSILSACIGSTSEALRAGK